MFTSDEIINLSLEVSGLIRPFQSPADCQQAAYKLLFEMLSIARVELIHLILTSVTIKLTLSRN